MSDESRRLEQAQRDLMRAQRALGAQARRYRALRESALVLARSVLGRPPGPAIGPGVPGGEDLPAERAARLAAESVLEIVVGEG